MYYINLFGVFWALWVWQSWLVALQDRILADVGDAILFYASQQYVRAALMGLLVYWLHGVRHVL